jgi:hypothetical protein
MDIRYRTKAITVGILAGALGFVLMWSSWALWQDHWAIQDDHPKVQALWNALARPMPNQSPPPAPEPGQKK